MMESGIGCIFDGKQFADKPNKCDRNGPNPATFESSSKDEYAGMTWLFFSLGQCWPRLLARSSKYVHVGIIWPF